jgi:hypothetical protein
MLWQTFVVQSKKQGSPSNLSLRSVPEYFCFSNHGKSPLDRNLISCEDAASCNSSPHGPSSQNAGSNSQSFTNEVLLLPLGTSLPGRRQRSLPIVSSVSST